MSSDSQQDAGPGAESARSGSRRGWRRGAALGLTAVAAGSLAAAFRLPFVRAELVLAFPVWVPDAVAAAVRDWLAATAHVPVGRQYLWGVIRRLFDTGEYVVGAALVLFSLAFPAAKIGLGAVLGAFAERLAPRRRQALLHALAVSAKWSMADVFVVAMMIVFFKADSLHFSFTAEAGLYCYAAAALSSSFAVALLARDVQTGP